MRRTPRHEFSAEDLRARVDRMQPLDVTDLSFRLQAGDHVTDPRLAPFLKSVSLRDAAVLIPVFARPQGATLLLTQRTDHLRAHAGQIALPGGKIDAGEGPLAAALREAEEEIGLKSHFVTPIGQLDPYVSYTGFRIFPVVALVSPQALLFPNPEEVADVFEVPLSFLMTPANHRLETRLWQGTDRTYYAMPFEKRRIWGVTAGILRLLYEQVYA